MIRSVEQFNKPLPVPYLANEIAPIGRASSPLPSEEQKQQLYPEKRKDRSPNSVDPTPLAPSILSPLKKSPKLCAVKSPSSLPKEIAPASQPKPEPEVIKPQRPIRKLVRNGLSRSRRNSLETTQNNSTRSDNNESSSSFYITGESAAKIEESSRTTTMSVSFNRRVRIRKIPILDQMPMEEIEARFYSEDEMSVIHNKLRKQIRFLVDQGVDVGDLVESDESSSACSSIQSQTVRNNTEYDCNYFWDYEDDDEEFCMRGIEQEFPRGKARRRRNRDNARSSVCEEQTVQRVQKELQGECGCNSNSNSNTMVPPEDSEEVIAEVYRKASWPALEHALEAARLDALAAEDIYAADWFVDDDDDSISRRRAACRRRQRPSSR